MKITKQPKIKPQYIQMNKQDKKQVKEVQKSIKSGLKVVTDIWNHISKAAYIGRIILVAAALWFLTGLLDVALHNWWYTTYGTGDSIFQQVNPIDSEHFVIPLTIAVTIEAIVAIFIIAIMLTNRKNKQILLQRMNQMSKQQMKSYNIKGTSWILVLIATGIATGTGLWVIFKILSGGGKHLWVLEILLGVLRMMILLAVSIPQFVKLGDRLMGMVNYQVTATPKATGKRVL
jgi:predicted small secreted protein